MWLYRTSQAVYRHNGAKFMSVATAVEAFERFSPALWGMNPAHIRDYRCSNCSWLGHAANHCCN